ncbi:MAG: hypothetical protein K9H84_03510 [Bacteroidales bacterium]|nr:hypothetical protein [Bacteroidales bacterium]
MESTITLKAAEEEIWRIEQFVEKTANEYNIFNSYYSNILVSIIEAVQHVKKGSDVTISFWSEKKGLFFTIKGQFEDINPESDFVYLIEKLSDEYKADNDFLCLVFSINSINKKLSSIRRDAFDRFIKGDSQKENEHESRKDGH